MTKIRKISATVTFDPPISGDDGGEEAVQTLGEAVLDDSAVIEFEFVEK